MLTLTALFCVAATAASAQTRTITGTVTGPDNLPVVGATVFATDGHNANVPLAGTTTDLNGQFSLNVPDGAASLTAQFIGYETQSVAIGGGRSVYDFALKDSSVMMEEANTKDTCTMTGERMLGAMCRSKIRPDPAPAARMAST